MATKDETAKNNVLTMHRVQVSVEDKGVYIYIKGAEDVTGGGGIPNKH